ncbi:MAG: nuclear transport factor 2 family protein [Rhodoferax sp.]|nr:nuclear transport factor 2 family protein [Rhodoferax sp.]
MERDAARAIEWDCSQTLLRFYDRFDRWDYEGMLDLCTMDGVWQRAGKELRGRDAIVSELKQRSRTQTVRHVLTNILVSAVDPAHANASCYLTAYRHDDGRMGNDDVPPVISLPAMLVLVTAQMLHSPQGWQISRQTMRRVFNFGNAS